MIASLQEITSRQRRILRTRHRGFIRQLARDLQVDHGLVSRIYNRRAGFKSAAVTSALIQRVNELLANDTARPNLCKEHPARRNRRTPNTTSAKISTGKRSRQKH